MKKRILSMLLAIVMVVGLMPASALAADGVTTVEDLQTAISAGGTVVLGGDIDLGSTTLTFPDSPPVTIDLNGKTLSKSQSGYVLELGAGDDVTITGNGTVSKAGGWYFFYNDSGHLTIEGGTYYKPDYDLVYMNGNSVTKITGGTFTLGNIFARQSNTSTGTIGGGTFTVNTISTGIWSEGISITGGAYKLNTTDTPVSGYVDANNYTVTKNADDSYTVSEKPATYAVTVTATPTEGGTVTADKTTAAAGETVTLTVTPNASYELESLTVGGTDVTAQVANGTYAFTMPAENVTVTATFKMPADPVASVTTAGGETTNYTDIKSATTAAEASIGSTLKLLDNITAGTHVTIDSGSFTIDLNGKTWQCSGYLMYVRGEADITIIDNSTEGTGKLLGTGNAYTIMLYGSANLEIAGGTVENNSVAAAIAMDAAGNPSESTLTVSGGKVVATDGSAISAFGKSVTVTGGTLESSGANIYYKTGVIDLSRHSNPTGITIYNDTGTEVTPGENTIKLPDGYVMLDERTNPDTVADTLAAYQTYTVGKVYKVSVSAVETGAGEAIEGAHLQIIDSTGNVVEEWVSITEVHEITGLNTGERYTLRATVAPDGYIIPTDTTFEIDENGNITTYGSLTEEGIILSVFEQTMVKVSAVETGAGEAIEGAHMQILKGTAVVDEWVSAVDDEDTDDVDESIHMVYGLKTGVAYTLRAVVAPDGYTIASDTTFSINEDGKVISTGVVTEEGIILSVFDITVVQFSAVDGANGTALAGATMQILNAENMVVEEWVFEADVEETVDVDESIRTVTGLNTGEEYTLRATVAPDGYTVPTDTQFSIDQSGNVTYGGSKNADGVLLVEFANTVTTYPLWVGGEQFTSEKLTITDGSGTATYDPDTNTLKLNNYTYEGAGYTYKYDSAAIYYGGTNPLNLVLVGTNSVTHTGNTNGFSYGVYSKANINVSGDGSLEAKGGNATGYSYGVHSADSIIVEDGSLIGTGNDCGVHADVSIKVSGGSLTGTSEKITSHGVYSAGSIIVEDGSLTGTSTGEYGYGVSAIDSITVSGGSLTGKGNSCGVYAYTGSITVSGGSLNGTAEGTNGYGVYAEGSIIVTGEGTLTGTGTGPYAVMIGNTTDSSYAKQSETTDAAGLTTVVLVAKTAAPVTEYPLWVGTQQFTENLLTITDSSGGTATYDPQTHTLTLNNYTYSGLGYGNEYEGAAICYNGEETLTLHLVGDNSITHSGSTAGSSYGFHAYYADIIFSGTGDLTISGGEAGRGSYGILVFHDLTLSGTGNLNVIGRKGIAHSVGINCLGSLTISAGTVNVTTGEADENVGINVNTALSVEGGSLNVTGGKASFNSYGIFSYGDFVLSDGTVNVTGGIGGTETGNFSCGIVTYDISVHDGHLTAVSSAAANSCGIYAFETFTLYGGVLEAAGQTLALSMAPAVDSGFTNAAVWYGDNAETAGEAKPIGDLATNYDQKYVKVAATEPDTYTVTVRADENGTVTTDKTTAAEGETVTITVTPDPGKRVDEVVVKDKDGNPVEVTKNPDGTYSYEQPAGDVTIEVTFENIPVYVDPSYRPTIEGSTGGNTTVSDKNPEKGDKVTITTDPDKGYEVGEVTVTDSSGNQVEVKDNGDGTYTYIQPVGSVTIRVTYKPIGCPSEAYSDLDTNAWYHEAADYVLENGLMNGVGNGKFDPNGTTNRAMIVTILWRLEGKPVVNYLMQFEDVSAESWYTEAVRWAASEGIVTGYSDVAFGPNDPITREQLATILYRYEQHKGGGFTGAWMFLLDYTDRDKVSDWAYEAMCWTTMHGVINGKGDGILDPKGSAKRCEAAQMLMNYLDK